MLESIDEQVEQIRLLSSISTIERREVSEELSWVRSYDAINKLMGVALNEEDTKSLFVSLYDEDKSRDDKDFADEFAQMAKEAWATFGKVDFVKYGIREPVTQLKVALYGLNRQKYRDLVPLHMRGKIDDILQVGRRKE